MSNFLIVKFIDAAEQNDLEELEFCLSLGSVDINEPNEVSVFL